VYEVRERVSDIKCSYAHGALRLRRVPLVGVLHWAGRQGHRLADGDPRVSASLEDCPTHGQRPRRAAGQGHRPPLLTVVYRG
jgi:hypothetical protein